MHSIGGYRKLIAIIAAILDHKYGHYLRSNKVVLKHHDFKKNADMDTHVKVFNYVIKTNA